MNPGKHISDCQKVFSPWGHLAFLSWVILLASLVSGSEILIVLGTVVAFSAFATPNLLLEGEGLELLCRRGFLLLIVSALAFSFFIGEETFEVLGLGFSLEGFKTGLWMALRALGIALAINTFAEAISVGGVAYLLERVGLKGLGFALGLALNVLPVLRENMENALNAIFLRGGFRRDRLKALKMLLVTVIASSLRRGDEIVDAAEARAFGVQGIRREPVPLGRSDTILISLLVILGAWLIFG